ncbi:MAG: hypothetical protein R3C10_27115 [Pirellulales bacterium]
MGFLDPLYSSGVFLALKTGELAADAITSALDAGDTSAARLGAWEPMVRDGYGRMRELVCAFTRASASPSSSSGIRIIRITSSRC